MVGYRHAIIVGAMKAGTSDLFERLSQHPEISGSRWKELNFFRDADGCARSYSDYLNHWDSCDAPVLLEASPAYTTSPLRTGVADAMQKSLPHIPFIIYLVRNPVSRIESQARHRLKRSGRDLDQTGLDRYAIDNSRYNYQIENFTKVFPKSAIRIIALEDLKHDPNMVLAQICEFLHVDKNFVFPEKNNVRNRSEKHTYLREFASKYPRASNFAKDALPTMVLSCIRVFADRYARVDRRTWLTDAELEVVRTELADDVDAFARNWGVDYSWALQRES